MGLGPSKPINTHAGEKDIWVYCSPLEIGSEKGMRLDSCSRLNFSEYGSTEEVLRILTVYMMLQRYAVGPSVIASGYRCFFA